MRSLVMMTMFVASLADAAWNGYEEVRELALDTRGIDTLDIDNGSGSMDITGVSGTGDIMVTATILVPGKNDDKARKRIEDDLILTLQQDSGVAVLKAYFKEGGFFSFGDGPSVQLDVRLPEGMHLQVDDGSGSIEISNVRGDVVLDDGSGSITMTDVGGTVEIDDGSGSISVQGVGGDISINDGSGSIKVRGVAGSVIIDDGSGSIDVSDVEEDLIIVDDGSGGLDFSNISGRIEKES
jgi:DUF4097 and DUF4098 domain-containing protein YvlB